MVFLPSLASLDAESTKMTYEGERFDVREGEVLADGEAKFIRVMKAGKLESKLPDILDDGEFTFLVRMRFPREVAAVGHGTVLKLTFGDQEKEIKTHTAGPWRWVDFGRYEVKEFEARKVAISCSNAAFDVDELVLWSEAVYRGEEWYREGVSKLWAKGSPLVPVFDDADGHYFIEAESAGVLRGEKKTLPDKTTAMGMSDESSELSFLLDVKKGASLQLLLKARSDGSPDTKPEGPVFVFLNGDLVGRVGARMPERWAWHQVARPILPAGMHLLSIRSGRTSVLIDKLALYGGDVRKIVMEDWYRVTRSPLYQDELKPGRTLAKGQMELSVEVEGLESLKADVMRDAASGGKALVFRKSGHADGLIAVEETTTVRAFARVYFDLENAIAGDANSLYLGFDAEGYGQLSSGVYNRYHWLATGPTTLLAGKHLLSIRSRELPVRIDKVVLYTGPDASKEPWYSEMFPEPMPFGIPNELRSDEAQQLQNWLIFGELARSGQVKLSHDVSKNQYYSVEVSLPRGRAGESLALRRRGHAVLRTYPAFAKRNRKQQVDMWVWGDGSGCEIRGVIVDADGQEFIAPFTEKVDWNGWQLVTMNLEPSRDEAGSLHWPEFPVTFKYIVVKKRSEPAATLRFEEPEFVRYLSYTASCSAENGKALFRLKNNSAIVRSISVYAASGSMADWREGKVGATHWDTDRIEVPASGSATCEVTLTRPREDGTGREPIGKIRPGVWCVLCRVGAEMPQPRFTFLTTTKDEQIRHLLGLARQEGAYPFVEKLPGEMKRREGVASRYGRLGGLRILVDGVDVCSREYATKAGHERLKPVGWDLSDANGWPFIHVPPGVLAIDPESERYKFAKGDTDPPRLAGRLNTGFGVPGSGRIAVKGDFAFVPAGEGDMTIVNCSDKRNPKVAAIRPSYHFTHSIVFSGDKAYMDARSGGVCLIDDLSDPEHPGPIRQIPWGWGRGIPALHPEAKLIYIFGGDTIKLIDISTPDQPNEIGEVKMGRAIGRFLMSHDRQYAYALADGGENLAVISLKNPREPRIVATVRNVKPSDLAPKKKEKTEEDEMLEPEDEPEEGEAPEEEAGGMALDVDLGDRTKELEKQFLAEPTAGLVAISETKLAMRLESTFVLYDLADPENPARCKHYTFNEKRMVIRDVGLKGDFLIVADGRQKGSQHSLNLGSPHSRLFVVDFTDRQNPKLAAAYEDPNVTEYANLTMHGDYAYVNDYDFGLWIFDLSDPRKPEKLGGTATAGEGHWGLVHGNYAFLGQTFGGSVVIIDVTDPTKPKRCGTYWDGLWMNYHARMAAAGKCLYVPKPSNLIIVEYSDPYHPKKVGEFTDEKGRALRDGKIIVEDDLAYVVCQKDGKAFLHTYDLADAARPKLIGAAVIEDKMVPFRIAKDGPRIFAAGDAGTYLHSVDVSDPKAPRVTCRFAAAQVRYGEKSYPFSKEGGWNGGVAACGGYVYVTIGAHPPGQPVVHIFDARDPARLTPVVPIHVRRGGWQFFYVDVLALGSYLYGGDYGVIDVFDVSDPQSPLSVGASGRDYQWTLGNVQGDYLCAGKLPALELVDIPRSSQIPKGKITVEIIPWK